MVLAPVAGGADAQRPVDEYPDQRQQCRRPAEDVEDLVGIAPGM